MGASGREFEVVVAAVAWVEKFSSSPSLGKGSFSRVQNVPQELRVAEKQQVREG